MEQCGNMITFDEKNQVFQLDTPNTSYLIGIVDGKYLGHIYYGNKIDDTDVIYLLRPEEIPSPARRAREKVNFLDAFSTEYSCGGAGDFRESCINVRAADGQEGLELGYVSHQIFAGKKALEGLPVTWGGEADCDTLEITLQDAASGLTAVLSYTAFRDTDAITRSVRIINRGQEVLYLTRALSLCLDMDNEDFEVISLPGAWGRERRIQRKPLGYGSTMFESLRGETSQQEHPFAAVVSANCTQTAGEVYAFNLVYSGNFMTKLSVNQFDSLRVVMGIHPERFCWKLEPGESFQAPEAVMVYSGQGLGAMTRAFHKLYREHLIRSPWKKKERPVLINSREATYFNFDTGKILALAREAAKAGIEMLVLDDGWFGHRNSDNNSLGDWFVNETKLPGGLKYLADEINALGMKFGLWMEPEMISADSELYRAHPDWVLRTGRREPAQCREQYVLDLSNPRVEDYIYGQIKNVLSSANIEYVKWDMNRPLSDVGSLSLAPDRQGEIMHRYMLAVYRMQERLLQDFPELLLENCSSGGARFDPGMLYYSPQIWCSDMTADVERLAIQEGTMMIYPLSTMGAHVSDCPNHATGRRTPFETRGQVALAGTFGYELDVRKISGEERAQIPSQIAAYKKYHGLISDGEYYRIASYQENHFYDCFEVVSQDQKTALVCFVQVLTEPNKKSRRLRLQGLREDWVYEVDGQKLSGRTLMNAGILMKRMQDDFQARMLEVRLSGEMTEWEAQLDEKSD
ncbi:MAG: alpha-galactosidase [Lachnospiraceae bacterium]|nr:alpha-galactosidase [Lachnospiraceae bacterium]